VDAADAIVIGAGHNGLVAANLLADAGWQVLVLEAADEPGGAVHTAEVTAPGFRNDLCSAFFPMTALSPVFAGLDLDSHGLRWTRAPVALGHLLPDDRLVALHRDLDRTTASVAEFAPEDAAAWTRLVEQWRSVRDPLLATLFGPFPPVRGAARLAGRTGVAELMRLARTLLLPARLLAEENFAGEGARLLIAGNALHADVGIDGAGSGVYGWLLAMAAQDVGFPVPVGGAGELTAALVRRLRSRGGEIRCGQRVREILIGRGRAVGVRDAAGEPIRARDAVLADVPAPTLYRDLVGLDHLPARLADDLRRFAWDGGTVKVDWALSAPIPWTNWDAAQAGTLHLGVDLDGMSQYCADLARHRVPGRPFVLLGQMTTADPTRSPAGTESAWAYTHIPHGRPVDADAVARSIEQAVERHAPGFRDLIVGRYVQGPEEFVGRDPGLLGGAINGGTGALHQQLFFRPVPGLGRPDTPVDRLFLAGSSAHPGGAVHGVPGANAARAALRRSGVFGDVYAGIVGAALRAIYA
jgi:phytoene dehydrogenase-like protein